MKFYGIDISEEAGRSDGADILRLLEAMRPKSSPAPLIRIGPGGDGSYLVPNDLDGIAACFSPGVNNVKFFEDQLTQDFGIPVHMCDASSDEHLLQTPLIEGRQTFEKLWLDVADASDAISLDAWVARHRPDPNEDLILQMDIEGAEYRNILQASDRTLRRFRIIVVEIHGLRQMTNADVLSKALLPFFDRLGQHFICVHAHPNNAALSDLRCVAGADVEVPHIIELTFIRADRMNSGTLHEVELPHARDIKYNSNARRPIFLDDFFRGRPPSGNELFRMADAISDWEQNQLTTLVNKVLRKAIAAENSTSAELRKLKRENQRLTKALQGIRASTSWRLTAPLRKIGSSLRRPTK